jgi:hypothetical protein
MKWGEGQVVNMLAVEVSVLRRGEGRYYLLVSPAVVSAVDRGV